MFMKKTVFWHVIIIVLLLSAVIWVFNNQYLYEETIIRVKTIESVKLSDHEIQQNITGIILNGDEKGELAKTQNTATLEGVFDEEYNVGDELFVKLKDLSSNGLECSILGVKRDKYLAILIAVFLYCVLAIAQKRGLFSLISVVINVSLFIYALDLYTKGYNILTLCNILVIIYTIVCMLLINGFNKKTISAIFSIIFSLVFTILIFMFAYHNSQGVEFYLMDYLISPKDLYELFMAEILICGLGAIMDVAISISSTLNELNEKDSTITTKKLYQSGRQVGYDIMGTMINVLLFTFICGSLPIITLQLKNGYSLMSIITLHIPFELYRFLSGSIGILLSVPVSIGISLLMMRKWGVRHD